jgi:hypothetical protein
MSGRRAVSLSGIVVVPVIVAYAISFVSFAVGGSGRWNNISHRHILDKGSATGMDRRR